MNATINWGNNDGLPGWGFGEGRGVEKRETEARNAGRQCYDGASSGVSKMTHRASAVGHLDRAGASLGLWRQGGVRVRAF